MRLAEGVNINDCLGDHFANKMIYRCKKCNNEMQAGWMPSSTCGILLLPMLGGGALMASIMWGALAEISGWLSWIAAIVAFGVGAVMVSLTMDLSDFLLAHCKRCSHCGSRKWSWGHTRGFGL